MCVSGGGTCSKVWVWRSEDNLRSLSFPCTIGFPGIEHRLSGLVASALTLWANPSASSVFPEPAFPFSLAVTHSSPQFTPRQKAFLRVLLSLPVLDYNWQLQEGRKYLYLSQTYHKKAGKQQMLARELNGHINQLAIAVNVNSFMWFIINSSESPGSSWTTVLNLLHLGAVFHCRAGLLALLGLIPSLQSCLLHPFLSLFPLSI